VEAMAAKGAAQETAFEWPLTGMSINHSAVTVLFMVFAASAEQLVEFVIESNRGMCNG